MVVGSVTNAPGVVDAATSVDVVIVGGAIKLDVAKVGGAIELDVATVGKAMEVAPAVVEGTTREDVTTGGGATTDVAMVVAMTDGSCADPATPSVVG